MKFLKAARGWWRKLTKLFRKQKKVNVMAMYDGKRCKVYCIDGVRLVGTVEVLEDRAWIRVSGKPKRCLLRTSQIASIVECPN